MWTVLEKWNIEIKFIYNIVYNYTAHTQTAARINLT